MVIAFIKRFHHLLGLEVILEAMDNKKDLLIEESSELLYHFLVLLADQGFTAGGY